MFALMEVMVMNDISLLTAPALLAIGLTEPERLFGLSLIHI